jgi:hypothetical protein
MTLDFAARPPQNTFEVRCASCLATEGVETGSLGRIAVWLDAFVARHRHDRALAPVPGPRSFDLDPFKAIEPS